MNLYRFSWCVCSFDQECNILASSKEKAIEIFKKKVPKIWKLNKPNVYNLNKTYKKDYTNKTTIHFKEIKKQI